MSDLSPRKVVMDPEWIPHVFSADGAELTFVHVPREDRAGLMFLSDQHYKDKYPKKTLSTAAMALALEGVKTSQQRFIFHTSFCCSTLMVQALEIPGLAVGMKEPDVLLDLANRFIRSDDALNMHQLELVLRLLARPFVTDETVIVKPTNFANRLIMPVFRAAPNARAVLLYSALPTFLGSLVKRGLWGRIFGRRLYRNLANWSALKLGFTPAETFLQTDLQIAGLAWLMQIDQFNRVAQRLGKERAIIVDSADFTANVAVKLGKIADFFGISLDSSAIDTIAAGPTFSHHSKFSQLEYSFDVRESEHSKIEGAHGEEIDMVTKWVETVAKQMHVPLQPQVASQ